MSSRDLVVAAAGSAGAAKDDYFKNVSLLLSGDGTNGAQNNTFIAANGAAQGPFADPAGYWSNYFDGNGDYLSVANNAALSLGTGDFTIEGWLNPGSQPGSFNAIVGSSATGGPILNLRGSGTSTSIGLNSYGSGDIFNISYTFTQNTWVHVAVARSGTSLRLFINGTQTGTTVTNSTNFSGYITSVAMADSGNQYFNGYISNLRIVKGTAVYTSNFTPSTTPLTAISGTSLLTCQSNVICDTSSNLFAITANGNAAVNTKSPFTISSTYNPYSFSGYFDNSGDYLSVANDTAWDVGAGDFTIECWANPYNSTEFGSIISKRPNTSTVVWISFICNAGNWLLYASSNGSTWDIASGAVIGTCTGGAWQHIAVVRNGSSFVGYLNGVGTTLATSSASISNSTASLLVGGDTNSIQFNGYISNLRFVKGTAVYTSNFTPSNEPLTAISGTSLLTCQSSTFVDNSPNAFAITANGNTTVATAALNPAMPITRNGNTTQGSFSPYGNLWSNYFDGNGDDLRVSGVAGNLGSNDFTIECWIYPTSSLTGSVLSKYNYSTNERSWQIWVTSGGGIEGYVSSTGSNFTYFSGGSGIQLNKWNHIALTRASGTIYGFINGGQVLSFSYATLYNSNAEPVVIANRSDYAQYFTGYISNVRIVNGTCLYSGSTYTVPTTPLTAVSGTSLLTCQSNRFIDNSSNNFTLTVNGNTSVQRFSPFNPTAPYSAATIGGSGYFDGTGDYLTAAANTALDVGSGDFTIEMFAFPFTKTNAVDAAFGYGNYTIMLYHNNTNWTLEMSNNGISNQISASFAVTLNSWQHLAIVKSGTSVSVYKNGVSAATGTISGSVNTSGKTLEVGRNGNAGQEFTGYLSNFRLVKGTAVYTSAFTPPTAPVTAISGTSLLCNFTNAGIPDAAMMNDLETVGNAQVSTSVKKYGTGSLAFDGSGDYLIIPQRPTLNILSGDFTIECWVYPSANTGLRTIIGQWRQGGLGGYLLYTTGTSFKFEFNEGAVNLTSSTTFTTNTWYHIAIVRYGSSFNMYVNGVSVASATYSGTQVELAVNTTMGNYYRSTGVIPTTNPDFNGYIDDLRISKGYARYTANFTPPAQALPTN